MSATIVSRSGLHRLIDFWHTADVPGARGPLVRLPRRARARLGLPPSLDDNNHAEDRARLPNIATRLLDRDEDTAILSRLEDDRVVPTELFRAPCWPERPAEVEGERRRVARVLRAAAVVVFGGGIIPEGDLERLCGSGVKGVFTPGATLETSVESFLREIPWEGSKHAGRNIK